MKRTNRIISSLILAAFLVNTVCSDLALGQSLTYKKSSDKLAAPSIFDSHITEEQTRQDAKRLEATIAAELGMALRKGMPANPDRTALAKALKPFSVGAASNFAPGNQKTTIYRSQAETYSSNGANMVALKGRFMDPAAPKGFTTLYGVAQLPLGRNKDGIIPVAVLRENAYAAMRASSSGADPVTRERIIKSLPTRKPVGQAAIDIVHLVTQFGVYVGDSNTLFVDENKLNRHLIADVMPQLDRAKQWDGVISYDSARGALVLTFVEAATLPTRSSSSGSAQATNRLTLDQRIAQITTGLPGRTLFKYRADPKSLETVAVEFTWPGQKEFHMFNIKDIVATTYVIPDDIDQYGSKMEENPPVVQEIVSFLKERLAGFDDLLERGTTEGYEIYRLNMPTRESTVAIFSLENIGNITLTVGNEKKVFPVESTPTPRSSSRGSAQATYIKHGDGPQGAAPTQITRFSELVSELREAWYAIREAEYKPAKDAARARYNDAVQAILENAHVTDAYDAPPFDEKNMILFNEGDIIAEYPKEGEGGEIRLYRYIELSSDFLGALARKDWGHVHLILEDLHFEPGRSLHKVLMSIEDYGMFRSQGRLKNVTPMVVRASSSGQLETSLEVTLGKIVRINGSLDMADRLQEPLRMALGEVIGSTLSGNDEAAAKLLETIIKNVETLGQSVEILKEVSETLNLRTASNKVGEAEDLLDPVSRQLYSIRADWTEGAQSRLTSVKGFILDTQRRLSTPEGVIELRSMSDEFNKTTGNLEMVAGALLDENSNTAIVGMRTPLELAQDLIMQAQRLVMESEPVRSSSSGTDTAPAMGTVESRTVGLSSILILHYDDMLMRMMQYQAKHYGIKKIKTVKITNLDEARRFLDEKDALRGNFDAIVVPYYIPGQKTTLEMESIGPLLANYINPPGRNRTIPVSVVTAFATHYSAVTPDEYDVDGFHLLNVVKAFLNDDLQEVMDAGQIVDIVKYQFTQETIKKMFDKLSTAASTPIRSSSSGKRYTGESARNAVYRSRQAEVEVVRDGQPIGRISRDEAVGRLGNSRYSVGTNPTNGRTELHKTSGINPYYRKSSSGSVSNVISVDDEIAAAKNWADNVGPQIKLPARNSVLFLSSGFYTNDTEYTKDDTELYSIFNIRLIHKDDPVGIINDVLGVIKDPRNPLDPKDVIIQLPSSAKGREVEIKKLLLDHGAKDARVVVIDTADLHQERDSRKRAEYRKNVYSLMLLMRSVDDTTTPDTELYQLLKFFIASHLDLPDASTAADQYIEHIKRNEITSLITMILRCMPIKRYEPADYKTVAAALISA